MEASGSADEAAAAMEATGSRSADEDADEDADEGATDGELYADAADGEAELYESSDDYPEESSDDEPDPRTEEERADEIAFAALADFLHNAHVPPQAVHAFIGDDTVDPRQVIPNAPGHIIEAALRARFVRNRATRSNYITSATGIGKLGVAAAAGDIEACAVALAYADVNTASQFDGRTAIWLAAEEGHEAAVGFLAAQGAKLDETADMEAYHNGGWERRGLSAACACTALYAAARRGHTDVVSTLLLLGADPNASDDLGRTPLSAACKMGHLDVVRRLAAQNDLRHRNAVLARFLPERPDEPVLDEQRRACAVAGASPPIDLDRPTCIGRTPLFMAAEAGSLPIVKILADHGADWAAPENQGYSPVDAAQVRGANAIVSYLQRIEAVPNASDIQLHIVVELRLAWAKASSGRLAEVSPVAFLSCDLLEMVAAFLPRRVVWERVFELEAMTQQAADAADERAAGADDKGRVLS